MFTSPASSHASSGTFGFPPVIGQGNQKGDAFGQTSSPLSSTMTFGAPLYAGFGSSTNALGHSSSSSSGSPSVFVQWNQTGDSFASKPHIGNGFGYSTGMSNSSSPLSTPTTFGVPLSYCIGSSTSGGPHATRSIFDLKQSHIRSQESGSRIANYKRTPETEDSAEKLVSISGMSVFKDKSHEELRLEDYKFTGQGGFGSSSSAIKSTSSGFAPFTSSAATNFSTNPWGTTSVSTTTMTPNPFGKMFHSETPTWSWKFPGPTSTSQPLPFSSSTNNSFTTSVTSSNTFNPFVSTSFKSPTFTPPGSTSPLWSLAPSNETPFTNPFTSFPTQTSSSTFSSPTFAPFITPPSLSGFWPAPLPATSTSTVTAPANTVFKNYNGPLTKTIGQPSSTFSGHTFEASTPSVVTIRSSSDDFWSTSIGGPSISMVTAPPNSVSHFSPTTTLFKPSVPSTKNYNETITGTVSEISSTIQPSSAPTPFGTLPPKYQLSFEGSRSTQSIQYGISSIPVKDKPALVRYPLLTTRHLSRRNNLPLRKYDPKLNGSKMPFFSDTKEIPVAEFIPRENPRALVVSPQMWPPKAITEDMDEEELTDSQYANEKDDPTEENNLFPTVLDVPSKLQLPGYYTKPQISELETKERAEPGFCSRVKDFVIGRHGYGHIKFLGETDVRNLDLERYVQFNNREVIVYNDDTKKPPVGQGLNKPAEITLLNIKCIDKRTGKEYKDVLKTDKYREMLKKKVVAQGGEFVSYDPVQGEWKFRVQHF